jgi:hypothetical protein
MSRSILGILTLALGATIVACASDYKVHAEKDPSPGSEDIEADSAEPEEEEEEEDTGEDNTVEDPPTDRPIAVCSVSPDKVRPISGSATWDGTESYDPNGLDIIDYDWTLVALPSGSTVSMPPGESIRAPFVPDLAGNYVAELIVTNEDGVESDPCGTTLQAEPSEALWVEMFWESSGDDMDLHLLAPGGTLRTESDCYFANCTWSPLDWGVSGSGQDDPILDLDDIPGTGPENINIEEPEDATYTVVVHDYPGSSFTPGNMVTINIYLDGSLAWTDSRLISGEDSYTNFATIDAASGTVTGL